MNRIKGNERVNMVEEGLRGLLLAALGGDAAAYREFLQTLSGHLRAFLRRRLHHLPDDVEDLVQETLLAVHNQRHTYRPDEPLTAWVYAIARYKLVDLLRARASRDALNAPLDEEMVIFAASDTEAREAKCDLGGLLATLPERQRVPIELVKLGGLSVAEAAQQTGMSESAIKVGIHRGLKALAARIRTSP
jgi:RNA polymerase sigma-70 factor (ECF subfamily)